MVREGGVGPTGSIGEGQLQSRGGELGQSVPTVLRKAGTDEHELTPNLPLLVNVSTEWDKPWPPRGGVKRRLGRLNMRVNRDLFQTQRNGQVAENLGPELAVMEVESFEVFQGHDPVGCDIVDRWSYSGKSKVAESRCTKQELKEL